MYAIGAALILLGVVGLVFEQYRRSGPNVRRREPFRMQRRQRPFDVIIGSCDVDNDDGNPGDRCCGWSWGFGDGDGGDGGGD